MFDKILKFINENEAKLLLLLGAVFIVLSSFDIDIKKTSISPSGHPSYPVLAVGILAFVISAVFMKKKDDDRKIIEKKETELKAAQEKAAALVAELAVAKAKEAELKAAQEALKELTVLRKQLDEVLAKQSLCYRCYGLKGIRNASESYNIFQDFKINDSNPNAVQFLWADTNKHNVINGEIIEGSIPCLRVRFHHKGGYGCNIAIRSKEWKALYNDKNYSCLSFDARIPKEERERDSELLETICIVVRVVNGYHQHWEYAIAPKKFLAVNTNEWGVQIRIDLAKKEWWHSFRDSDGNPDGPTYPDFSIISAVILKFGKRPNGYQELDPGKGVIDIREIRLV